MRTRMSDYESIKRIGREAAGWLMILKGDCRISLWLACQFLRWLLSSHLHFREFIKLWREDDRLIRAILARAAIERDRSDVTQEGGWWRALLKSAHSWHRYHVAGWGVSAALVLSTAYIVTFQSGVGTSNGDGNGHGNGAIATVVSNGTIARAADEPKTIRLEDGSVVTLDAGTSLQIEFTSKRRDLRLLSGRATFDVAKDPKRPFAVRTHLATALAVGTVFVVLIDDEGVEVEVYEGIVSVWGRKPGSAVFPLRGGDPPHRVPGR